MTPVSQQVTIRRRVLKDNQYQQIEERANLVKNGKKSCLVRLSNGDVIKRKLKDIVMEDSND